MRDKNKKEDGNDCQTYDKDHLEDRSRDKCETCTENERKKYEYESDNDSSEVYEQECKIESNRDIYMV